MFTSLYIRSSTTIQRTTGWMDTTVKWNCDKTTFGKNLKKIITKSLNGRNVTLSKEAKLSHSWMVLTAESWEHSGIFYYYFLIFWQNIPLCSQLSAVRTIQLWLNLASLKSKQTRAFFEKICFSAMKHHLETVLMCSNIQPPCCPLSSSIYKHR